MSTVAVEQLLQQSEVLEKLLLSSNLRLVHAVAMQHQGLGMEVDDLVYEGVKGLKHAMSRFDPKKGFAFSTYAFPWIREYIRAALAKALPISLPRHVYRLLVKVRAIQQQFAASGRLPTDEELAEEMGISMERFEIVRRAINLAERSNSLTPATTLSGPASGRIQYEEATWERVIESHTVGSVVEHVASSASQPHAHLERTQGEMRAAVLKALNTLPEDEARAIYQRLGLGSAPETIPLNYSQLERSLGVDPETARMLYQKGVRRMRRRLLSVDTTKYPEMKSLHRIFSELQVSEEVSDGYKMSV
jgi:RNA polymerase sigma factor (sigma-70 family)